MKDLIFTHYLPDDEIEEESFLITSASDRGDEWLVDNADTTSSAPEGQEFIPAGNAWINTKDEFERLLAKSRADGLTVHREDE